MQTLAPAGGRDLFVWGLNRDYELGNGRRTNLATPVSLEGRDGRVMLMRRSVSGGQAVEVKDMQGRRWKGGKGVAVEQRAVAGYGASVVYWRIC